MEVIVNKKKQEPDSQFEFEAALKFLDADKDGKIPIHEMRWILTQLGDKMEESEVDDLIKEVCKDVADLKDPLTAFVTLSEFKEIIFPDEEKKKAQKAATKGGKDAKPKGKK